MFRGKCPVGRFLLKINITESGCWEWQGSKNQGGYGSFSVNGKHISSHRFAWIFTNGEIPNGLEPDHLCRNRVCANPNHLEIVTRSENTLRGIGPDLIRAKQLAKTHCPCGHPYDETNTRYYLNGRYCRTCQREAQRVYYRKTLVKGTKWYQGIDVLVTRDNKGRFALKASVEEKT